MLEVKSTNLTKYLKTLMDLDILERRVPVTEENPEKSKRGLYKIKDTKGRNAYGKQNATKSDTFLRLRR